MILPDGAIELIFNLGDAQKLCASDDLGKNTVFHTSWISGERTSPIVIEEAGYVDLIGVRLRAGGGWPFLGIPVREFTDQVVELESFLERDVVDLREKLGEISGDDARFDLLEGWLIQGARARFQPTPSVTRALSMIRAEPHGMRVGNIASEIGISHKHLLREFDRCVGLTPKLFARLCSFQRVIHFVGQKLDVDWAGIAATCGYYDQAHLIHEFRAFSGLTPASYLGRRGPFLNYLEIR